MIATIRAMLAADHTIMDTRVISDLEAEVCSHNAVHVRYRRYDAKYDVTDLYEYCSRCSASYNAEVCEADHDHE